MTKAQTDPRPNELKREMALKFHQQEQDYRDSDWCNVVYEDDQVVLIEDEHGYEWDEWASESDDYAAFSSGMHNLASQLVDRRWPSTWPIVFDKLEVADEDCPCCGYTVVHTGTAEDDIWQCIECDRCYDRSVGGDSDE